MTISITLPMGLVMRNMPTLLNGMEQEMLVFVPERDAVKVQILTLKNQEPKKRKIKLIYYVKPVLDEEESKSHTFLKMTEDGSNHGALFENKVQMDGKQVGYVASSETIQSVTGDRFSFLGNSSLDNPEGLAKEQTQELEKRLKELIVLLAKMK